MWRRYFRKAMKSLFNRNANEGQQYQHVSKLSWLGAP